MATFKREFQELATELLTDEFLDFMQDCLFEVQGTYDPITGTYTGGASQTVPALRVDYDASQIDSQAIQVSDFQLIARVAEFAAINPRTDGLKVTVDGVVCTVITAEKDPADAVWIIQARA